MKTIIATILITASVTVSAENWNDNFKLYSHNLYQQGRAYEAQQLARWFKVRENVRNGSVLGLYQMMALHHSNDADFNAMNDMENYSLNSSGRYK